MKRFEKYQRVCEQLGILNKGGRAELVVANYDQKLKDDIHNESHFRNGISVGRQSFGVSMLYANCDPSDVRTLFCKSCKPIAIIYTACFMPRRKFSPFVVGNPFSLNVPSKLLFPLPRCLQRNCRPMLFYRSCVSGRPSSVSQKATKTITLEENILMAASVTVEEGCVSNF